MAKSKNDLKALRNLILQAQTIIAQTPLPEGRSERAAERLAAAAKLADFLLLESPAAALGKKGGAVMAKRGPDYFRKIAAMRQNRKGGRPKAN